MNTSLEDFMNYSLYYERSIEGALYRRGMEETVDFILQHFDLHNMYPTRKEHIEQSLLMAPEIGMLTEFGVFEGKSLRWVAAKTQRPIYGFDSFLGIPEPWKFLRKGALKAKKPIVPPHVTLIEGWFEDTAVPFLREKNQPLAWVHIDCDVYSGTKTVLNAIYPYLQKGTVILFDDFFGYPKWKTSGNYKAWQEFIENHNIGFSYHGFGKDTQQASLVIENAS